MTYQHYAGIYQTVNLQGEVGLLTRNIVIRGDPTSDSDAFGVHVMVMGSATGVFSGIEVCFLPLPLPLPLLLLLFLSFTFSFSSFSRQVTRGGQRGFLGRYPIHFHRLGDSPDSAVLDSSIHHNYQRALTVHGTISSLPPSFPPSLPPYLPLSSFPLATNVLTIARNVAYKTHGHMYFLEDAIETGNKFLYNLGMVVYLIPPAEQLPPIHSDDGPAVMWITNPNNTFLHNSWSGSPHFCVWSAMIIYLK